MTTAVFGGGGLASQTWFMLRDHYPLQPQYTQLSASVSPVPAVFRLRCLHLFLGSYLFHSLHPVQVLWGYDSATKTVLAILGFVSEASWKFFFFF